MRPRIRQSLAALRGLSCKRYLSIEPDVTNAQRYCLAQLQKGDREAALIYRFLPPRAQATYALLRTLNLELLSLPDTVSNAAIAQMRLQFWRDSLEAAFAGRPPREPVCVLADAVARDLRTRAGAEDAHPDAAQGLKWWTMRLLRTRAAHADGRPFVGLAALEEYAENTYSTMMYGTLAGLGLRSVHVDHLASHVGKAAGIVAVLRGISVLAAPPRPTAVATTRRQSLLLPLDVMSETGLREEDVFRAGPRAPGLRDAVFRVATHAHDHLLTAQAMLANVRAGRDAGHEFEHARDDGHRYDASGGGGDGDAARDVARGFDVLLEAVPAREYLRQLERHDFNPFVGGWSLSNALLPLRLWQAAKRQQF